MLAEQQRGLGAERAAGVESSNIALAGPGRGTSTDEEGNLTSSGCRPAASATAIAAASPSVLAA